MTTATRLAVALLLALPSAAAAECGAGGAFFAPETGTIVPQDPVLFYFAYPLGAEAPTFAAKDADGKPLPVTATQVTKAEALVAYRVAVQASSGAILVEARHGPSGIPSEARYRVGAAGGCAEETPVEIAAVETGFLDSACTYESTRILVVAGGAPAYRVEWARTEAEFRAGMRDTVVLPDDMLRFSHGGELPSFPRGPARLRLGHLMCRGRTMLWDAPAYWVGVTALHTDGREDPPARPVRVDAPSLDR